jgi:pilus assembly protein CpaB
MARINSGTMGAVVFAMLVGLGGAYGVRHYLREEPETPKAPAPILVPTAAYDLRPGRTLTLNDIVVRRFTKAEYENSEYAGRQFMTNTQQIAGRTLREPIQGGTAFNTRNFYPDGMGPGVADMLKPGQMAMTIPLSGSALVGGFVSPGALVDVMFRSRIQRSEVTMTLLERVPVLAVGRAALPDQSAEAADSVTVAVSAYQAKSLQAVQGRGDLSLALRSPEETAAYSLTQETDRIRLEELLGVLRRAQPPQMEVYLGTSRQTLQFADAKPVDSPFAISTPVAFEAPEPSLAQHGKPKVRATSARFSQLAHTDEAPSND